MTSEEGYGDQHEEAVLTSGGLADLTVGLYCSIILAGEHAVAG